MKRQARPPGARVLASVFAVVAAFSVTACGGDDDGETASPTTTVVATTTTGVKFSGDPDSEFCRLARANIADLGQIGASVADPGQFDRLLRDAAPAVRHAASIAPPEIKSDVEVLAEAFGDLIEGLDEGGQPNLAALGAPEFQGAAQNLNAYARQVCGITG